MKACSAEGAGRVGTALLPDALLQVVPVLLKLVADGTERLEDAKLAQAIVVAWAAERKEVVDDFTAPLGVGAR